MTQPPAPAPGDFQAPDPGAGGAGDDPALAGPLRRFADAFWSGGGPVLTTLLSRSVTLALASVEAVTPEALLAQVPLPWVVMKAQYARGLTGTHSLLLPLPGALALARAVLGAAPDAPAELDGAHEDAIKEAAAQMLSGSAATLMPLLTRSLAFAPVTLWLAEDGSALPPELGEPGRRTWVSRAELSAEGVQASVYLIIGDALARELGASVAEPEDADADTEPGVPGGRLDLILDISLPVSVELGRARMQIQDILKLGPGSVIELEKSAGDPVELFVNDRPIARGEVVVIDENFGIRLTSIVTATERIRTLR